MIAEWPRPSWGAGADPVHGVAHPPHAPALLVATLAVPTVRALVLALVSLESRLAVALSVDVVADGAVVAVAPLLAVQVVAPRRTGVRAHRTRPAHGAVALPGDGVALARFWQAHRLVQFAPCFPGGQGSSHSAPLQPAAHVQAPDMWSHTPPF